MENWDYKAMGFHSWTEMNESVKRVKERMNNPKSEAQQGLDNKAEFSAMLGPENKVDMNELGAMMSESNRLADLDNGVYNQIIYDREQAKRLEHEKEMQSMFKALADETRKENEAKAQKEWEEEQASLEEQKQESIYNKHNVKTDKQKSIDEKLTNLIDNLMG